MLIKTGYCSLRLILEKQQEVGTLRYQTQLKSAFNNFIQLHLTHVNLFLRAIFP